MLDLHVKAKIRKDGEAYVVDVDPCLSCGKGMHLGATIVREKGSVWFRCPKSKALIYLREEKA